MFVVYSETSPVGIGVGHEAGQEHFVRARTDPGHQIVRLESGLVDLGVPVGGVLIEYKTAYIVQRIVAVRPDFCQVEGVESVVFGLFERHDLDLERPARKVPILDGVKQVSAMIVGVLAGHLVSLFLGEKIDALVCLEVVLHPELLTLGVDPHVGVARISVHVPPGLRDAPVAHEPGHLMGAFR